MLEISKLSWKCQSNLLYRIPETQREDSFWDFLTSILLQRNKKTEDGNFLRPYISFEKMSPMPKKNDKGRILWPFSSYILSENSEKRRRNLFFQTKSRIAEKTELGHIGLVRFCMLRGKLFWFSFSDKHVQFDVFFKFGRNFSRLVWPLLVYRKKTVTKSHDWSRLVSHEKSQ